MYCLFVLCIVYFNFVGSSFVVYNVHSMSHIPDDVQHFQCSVNRMSAFPFENHLQSVKKLVKNAHNPIGQVFSRLSERREQNIFKHKKVIQPYISTRSEDSIFYLHDTKNILSLCNNSSYDTMQQLGN